MKLSPQNSFTCVQNQTLLSNYRQSDQNDIHYQAVSKQYTKKQKTHCSKYIVLERYLWTAILFRLTRDTLPYHQKVQGEVHF